MKHNIHPSLLPLAMPIDEIHLDPANARTGHNVERIAGSLALCDALSPLKRGSFLGNALPNGTR